MKAVPNTKTNSVKRLYCTLSCERDPGVARTPVEDTHWVL